MNYCKYCDRQVQGKKQVNWFWFIVLLIITGGAWLIFYIPYYVLLKTKHCPICGGDL